MTDGRIYVKSTAATRGEPEPEVEVDVDELTEEQLEQVKAVVDQAALAKIDELEAKVTELEAELAAKAEGEPEKVTEPAKTDGGDTTEVKEPAKKAAPAPKK